MKNWLQKTLPATAVLMAIITGCAGAGINRSLTTQDSSEEKVDRLLGEWVDPESPGAAVGVVRNGKLILKKGYGLANMDHYIAVTSSTVFNLGSIAKQFTAFAIAILIDQGKIFLDDDIRKHLPELPDFGNLITIKHLIDHTSGLRDFPNLLKVAGYVEEDLITDAYVLKLMTKQKELNFSPGEKWQYCNTGYTLLAEIVARVTGKSFREWTDENIFKPLGMANTHFYEDIELVIRNRADSYDFDFDSKTYNKNIYNLAATGCSNLYSTVEDIAKWINNFNTAQVGGPSVLELMGKHAALNNGETTDYAFGQFIKKYKGLEIAEHTGHIAGFLCYLIRFPEQDFAVVILSNVSYFDVVGVGRKIVDFYLSEQLEKSAPESKPEVEMKPETKKRTLIKLESSLLKTYTGSFKLRLGGKLLKVELREDDLYLHNLARGIPIKLSPFSNTKFYMEGMGAELALKLDKAGRVIQLDIRGRSQVLTADRVEEIQFTSDQLAEYCGVYYSEELGSVYTIQVQNGELGAIHSRFPDTLLTPLSQTEFSGENSWLRNVKFEMNENKNITGFRVSVIGAENVLFQKIRK